MKYFVQVPPLINRANTYINSIGTRIGNELWLDYISSALKLLRAGRTLPWSRQRSSFPVYTDILKYPLPTGFSSLVLLAGPLINGQQVGVQTKHTTEKEFDQISDLSLAVGWEHGDRFLLVRQDGQSDTEIDEFDDDATDYTLTGDINNAIRDYSEFRSGDASLKFDIYQSVSNNFLIERTLDESIDISEIKGLARMFIHMKMPTIIPGIKLRIGSDSSNYYETDLLDKQFTDLDFNDDEWNLLSATLSSCSVIGTPVDTAIQYMAIYCPDTDGVIDVDFRVDGFYLRVGSNFVLTYNDYNIVQKSSADKTYQSIVDNVDNLILWDEDFDDLLLYKILDLGGFFNFRDLDLVNKASENYKRLNELFEGRYPSLEEHFHTTYYKRVNRF